MEHTTFLQQFAQQLIQKHHYQFDEVIVVLPNKRAKLFLWEALKEHSSLPFFAPQIVSIEDFVTDLSDLTVIDAVDTLFQFYEVYRKVAQEKHLVVESFDLFANWAKMLLADFNEIDRYLLDPDHVFSYLKDIEDLKHWSVDAEQQTELIKKYIVFWEMMPLYYHRLKAELLSKSIGYQGMIYRKAVELLPAKSKELAQKKIYFVGFNALNQAEEKIIQYLLQLDIARVYWDTDQLFLEDTYHDAGYFARKIKSQWPYYNTHPYEWIQQKFALPKNIEVISTPKAVGQARIAAEIIERLVEEGVDLTKTALVLGDELLLEPILLSLPQSVGPLNITMGYESKSNPIQLFIQKWFKMHVNAYHRNEKNPVFYHKDFIEVFTHPLLVSSKEAKDMVKKVYQNNLTFFSSTHFQQQETIQDPLVQVLYHPFTDSIQQLLERTFQLLFLLKEAFSKAEDALSLTFLYSIFQTLQKVKKYVEQYTFITTVDQFYQIYKEMIQLAKVSFEGEPLRGLQIMGVLESRVLDFENVIITSANEGVFPSGKMSESFIPYDLKREFGMPTTKEKDAIYTYHFYHLLQRAKNVYLIYNSDNESGNNGEKSRFITQLQVEKQPLHELHFSTYFAQTPNTASQPMSIESTPQLRDTLHKIATQSGFSPSALNAYLRNPIQFYFQSLLKIRQVEEVEENVAANTLGTIIHNTLEYLYMPYVGQMMQVDFYTKMLSEVEHEVNKQFREVYAATDEKTGKNLISYEIAKNNIVHFLESEKKEVAAGSALRILALEARLQTTLEHDTLPYPVQISGIVDRIEERDGFLRIIDYKTGSVAPSKVKVTTNVNITENDKYDKVIQLLMYAFMYERKSNDLPLQVGIYSFKNKKEGYMLLEIKDNPEKHLMSPENIEGFKEQLIALIAKILDPSLVLEEVVID